MDGPGAPEGNVHFGHGVILFVHGVTYFQQHVILEQNFMGPTHVAKNEVQNEIWTVQIFFLSNIDRELLTNGPPDYRPPTQIRILLVLVFN